MLYEPTHPARLRKGAVRRSPQLLTVRIRSQQDVLKL
jgi:hypothetical protein